MNKRIVILQEKNYLGFFSSNSVDGKAALDIIYQAEVLTSLVNGDNICVTN